MTSRFEAQSPDERAHELGKLLMMDSFVESHEEKLARVTTIHQLLEMEINVNVSGLLGIRGQTLLHVAVKMNLPEFIEILIDKGANKEAEDSFNYTPLMSACHNNFYNVVELLINKGANKEAVDSSGNTPLLKACTQNLSDIAELLINLGANVNAVNIDNYTPLLKACDLNMYNTVELLIDKGANKEAVDLDGYTPLLVACEKNHSNIVELLIDKGANKEAVDNYGNTPLLLAANNNLTDTVAVLIHKGADKEAVDEDGSTAFMIAERKNFLFVQALLAADYNDENNLLAENGNGSPENERSEPRPIYSFFGHAGHLDSQLDIPPGCMLITLAQCGEVSEYGNDTLPFRKLTTMFEFPGFVNILSDPIRNKTIIESVIGAPISINHPNASHPVKQKYYDIKYGGHLVSYSSPRVVHHSGLYKAGTNTSFHTKMYPEKEIGNTKFIDFMFPDEVIYPTREDVLGAIAGPLEGKKGMDLVDNIGEMFSVNQSTLFRDHPGIYYHMTCRVPLSRDDMFGVRIGLRKQLSRSENDIPDYNHNPHLFYKLLESGHINNKKHQGVIGQSYRLPLGVDYSNYIYENKAPRFKGLDEKGRQLIEIVAKDEAAAAEWAHVENTRPKPSNGLDEAARLRQIQNTNTRFRRFVSVPSEGLKPRPGPVEGTSEATKATGALVEMIYNKTIAGLRESRALKSIIKRVTPLVREEMIKLGFFETEMVRVSTNIFALITQWVQRYGSELAAEEPRLSDLFKSQLIGIITDGMRQDAPEGYENVRRATEAVGGAGSGTAGGGRRKRSRTLRKSTHKKRRTLRKWNR